MARFVYTIFVIAAIAVAAAWGATHDPAPDGLTVTRWVDGDTAACGDDCRVRLLGVNTPERGEPGYQYATDYAERVAPVGSRIVLPTDETDRYGRHLGYVVTSDGQDYGLTAIVAGTAVPCYDHEPPVSSLCPGSGGYPAHEMGDAYHDAWEQWGR